MECPLKHLLNEANFLKNKKFLTFIDQKGITVTDSAGICLLSSDHKKVGCKIDLSLINQENINEFNTYNLPNEAVLFLNKIEQDEVNRQFLKLVDLLLNQFDENRSKSTDLFDQFVNKITNRLKENMLTKNYELEAKSLGIDWSIRKVGILVHFKDFTKKYLTPTEQIVVNSEEVINRFKKKIASSLKSFFTQNNDLLVAYTDKDQFFILKSLEANEESKFQNYMIKAHASIFTPVKNAKDDQIAVGFGNAYQGINGLLETYKEASIALRIGLKSCGQWDQSYYFGDLKDLRIIAEEDNSKKILYAQEMIKILNKRLKQTLEVFFDQNLNLTETAQKLKLHPNTIIYRLNQIGQTINLNPRVFNQAFIIKMALTVIKVLD